MAVLCLILLAGIAVCDLCLKRWVEKNVESRKDTEFAGGHLILRKVHNKGAMMGLGAKYPWLIRVVSIGITLLVIVMECMLLRKPEMLKEKIALALIGGGAISNTADRIKRKYVVDYIAFKSKNKKVTNVTYNIGDFAIFAGAMLIMVSTILDGKK